MNDFSEINMDSLKKIYSTIVDEKSRSIFINRLLYSVTNNYKYIREITGFEDIAQKLQKFEKENRKMIVFGAGYWGKFIVNIIFKDIKWECFADNNLAGKEVEGLRVISFEELKNKYFDSVVVISPWEVNLDIYNQLMENNFDESRIINLGEYIQNRYNEIMSKEQYFEFPCTNNSQESFVDAGCLDGDSSKKFVEWCGGNYSHIWAFEPDPINYEICKKELAPFKCTLYNMGTLDTENTVCFNATNDGKSRINDEGTSIIKTVKLDDILENKKVTFIKMDIEGAELKALQGAENIIRNQKPRLAISVYHKPEDIISIPNLILTYNPDYELRLRHYYIGGAETILYAF